MRIVSGLIARISVGLLWTLAVFYVPVSINASSSPVATAPSADEQTTVSSGDTVTVRLYEIQGDSVVQQFFPESEYMNFKVGHGEVLPGLDDAVSGMELLEEKRVTLSPPEAFGEKDSSLYIALPRSAVQFSEEIKPGMIIRFRDHAGNMVPREVIGVHENQILIDMNHPLAGHKLDLTIQIVSISK